MAIIKSKHASNYTVIPNEVFTSNLSIDAIGLLCYFLSLPHDWVIYKTTLHNQLGLGRDKLDKIFKELVDKGYVLSVEKRTDGKISYEHIVYDKPFNGEPSTEKPLTEKPLTVKPYTAEPFTENQQLLSTNKPSTNKQNNNKINKNIPTFEEFKTYALEHKQVSLSELELKYKSWVENGWRDGKNSKIENWKTKLLNTLPYLPESKQTIKHTKGTIENNHF